MDGGEFDIKSSATCLSSESPTNLIRRRLNEGLFYKQEVPLLVRGDREDVGKIYEQVVPRKMLSLEDSSMASSAA